MPSMTAYEPEYLTIARRDIGQRETLGPNDSPFIRSMLKRLGLSWLLGQPWCGSIMADWMRRSGYPVPPEAYRALSWAAWGMWIPAAKHGAVAVLKRKGGGHVGIVTGVSLDWKHVRLLGGNQGNAVSEAWFPMSRVTEFREPPGGRLDRAVICAVGTLSASEA